MIKRYVFLISLLASVLPGCPKAKEQEPEASVNAKDDEEKPSIVCHLDCSGKEASASGKTEAEARAKLQEQVEKLCQPDDGQHFIFCEEEKIE